MKLHDILPRIKEALDNDLFVEVSFGEDTVIYGVTKFNSKKQLDQLCLSTTAGDKEYYIKGDEYGRSTKSWKTFVKRLEYACQNVIDKDIMELKIDHKIQPLEESCNFNHLTEQLQKYVPTEEELKEDKEEEAYKSAVDYLNQVEAGDDISLEILDPNFDGELYLTAEEFTRDERENLGSFCLAIADPNATVNVNKFVSDLENILERIMYQENVINKTMSDDGFAYAISSLDMGTRLFEFGQNLKNKKGQDLCIAIQNSDICRKASELSEELARYYDSLGE